MYCPPGQLPLIRRWTVEGVMTIAPRRLAGRGLPPEPVVVVGTNVPALPALSCHVPESDDRLSVARRCTGTAPGVVTMLIPRPMSPPGSAAAVPTIEAFSPPH